MKHTSSLSLSIISTLVILLSAQFIFFGTVALLFHIPAATIALFCSITIIFHIIIALALLKMKACFISEETGKIFSKINTANIITLIRISSIPTLFFLFLNHQIHEIKIITICFLAFIFLTDFIDGLVARKFKEITPMGKYLDSSSDYLLLVFTSIIYLIFNLMPTWLFILITARLLLIGVTILVLSIINKHFVYIISFLGKCFIFLTMVLYVLKLIPFFIARNNVLSFIIQILEYVVGAIAVISLTERIILIFKTKKSIFSYKN